MKILPLLLGLSLASGSTAGAPAKKPEAAKKAPTPAAPDEAKLWRDLKSKTLSPMDKRAKIIAYADARKWLGLPFEKLADYVPTGTLESYARKRAGACSTGSGADCWASGLLYARGFGVEQDQPKAYGLYRAACGMGRPEGCVEAGLMAYSGNGIPQNAVDAADFFKRGCDAGSAEACYSLGFSHAKGDGVPKNMDAALAQWDKACGLGGAKACAHLGALYEDGTSVRRDMLKSSQYHEKGCDAGSASECRITGDMYGSGRGVLIDKPRADAAYAKEKKASAP